MIMAAKTMINAKNTKRILDPISWHRLKGMDLGEYILILQPSWASNNDSVLKKSGGNNQFSYVNSPSLAGFVFLKMFVYNYLKPMGVTWDM